MNGWFVLQRIAQAQAGSVLIDASVLGQPDGAAAVVVGGLALSRRLGARVNLAPDGPMPGDPYGWPDTVRTWLSCPVIESVECRASASDTCVVEVRDDDALEACLQYVLRELRPLGRRSLFAAHFIDLAVNCSLQHSSERTAYIAVRTGRGSLWVSVGDTGPGVPATSTAPRPLGGSALAYWTQRVTPGERGAGELAAIWRACSVMQADAYIASGNELQELSRTGVFNTFFGGGGPTLISARV